MTMYLASQLKHWADLVSSGYTVPAAGTVMLTAADRLETLEHQLIQARQQIEQLTQQLNSLKENTDESR